MKKTAAWTLCVAVSLPFALLAAPPAAAPQAASPNAPAAKGYDKAALVTAIQGLSSKDTDTRDRSLDLIAGSTYRGHDLVKPLLPMLADPASRTRSQAAKILGEVGDPVAISALRPMLKDSTSRGRREAVRALRLLKAREALPDFLELCGDRSEEVSLEAIQGLQQFKDPRAVKPLTEIMVNGQTYRLRSAAIQALGDLGSSEPISQMIVLMDYERDLWLRLDLARALAKIGDPEAQTALMRALDNAKREGNQQSEARRKNLYNEVIAEFEKALNELKANSLKPRVGKTAPKPEAPTQWTKKTDDTPPPNIAPETNTSGTVTPPPAEDPFGDDHDEGYETTKPAAPAEAAPEQPVAPVKPPAKSKTKAAAKRGSGYTLQVKATDDEKLAQTTVDEIKAKGEEASLLPFTKDGATWYRVRVGSFPSKSEAEQYGQALKKRQVISEFFVSPN